MTEKVIVSRRWKTELPIEAYATYDEVGSRMLVKDFILALADEMSDIGIERDLVKRSLQTASERVMKEMKSKTRFVVE